MVPYRERLRQLVAKRGNLCVGIDPHPQLLDRWGLPDSVLGLESFALTLVEAVGDQVAVFKPQSAFFEAYGSGGTAILARTLRAIGEVGALSILDVKRGDIGSTMEAYSRAYLGQSTDLRADAVTLSPYLGFGSLEPACTLAQQTGAGVYVLARTSNPEGHSLQLSADPSGRGVAQTIVDDASLWSVNHNFAGVGLVIGATLKTLDLELSEFDGSILAPGIGAQGGRLDQLENLFGATAKNVLPSVSRGILAAGPRASLLRQQVNRYLD